MVDRRLIYRAIASALLWLVIIIVFIFSLRSVGIIAETGQIAKQAITVKDEMQITNVRELAKAFAVEWGTWRSDKEEYHSRLKTFIGKTDNISLPEGVQEVISASITGVLQEKRDIFRVRLILHTRKIIDVNRSNIGLTPDVYAPLTREELRLVVKGDNSDNIIPVWKNDIIGLEVPVKIIDGMPVIANIPALIKIDDVSKSVSVSGYRSIARQDVKMFVEQFLDLYYSGGSIKNFTTVDANIAPLLGWQLNKVEMIKADSDKNPTKVHVQVSVSTDGVESLTQSVYLNIVPGGNSYLVDKLSSFD